MKRYFRPSQIFVTPHVLFACDSGVSVVVVIDITKPELQSLVSVPIPSNEYWLASAYGKSLWIWSSSAQRTLYHVQQGGQVACIEIGYSVHSLLADTGGCWVLSEIDDTRLPHGQDENPTTELLLIDKETSMVRSFLLAGIPHGIGLIGGQCWVSTLHKDQDCQGTKTVWWHQDREEGNFERGQPNLDSLESATWSSTPWRSFRDLPRLYRRDLTGVTPLGLDAHLLLRLSHTNAKAEEIRRLNGMVIWPLNEDQRNIIASVPLGGTLLDTQSIDDSLYCSIASDDGIKIVRHDGSEPSVMTIIGEHDFDVSTFLQRPQWFGLDHSPEEEVLQQLAEVKAFFQRGWGSSEQIHPPAAAIEEVKVLKQSGWSAAPPRNPSKDAIEGVKVLEIEAVDSWPDTTIEITFTSTQRPGVIFVRKFRAFRENGMPSQYDIPISMMEDLETGRLPLPNQYRYDSRGRVLTQPL